MILTCGESLIDMVPDETAEGAVFRPLPGGSVYNTAIALGRLGVDTGYLWPISRDPFGEALLRPLAEARVDTGLCPRTGRVTTLAFVTLAGGEARYSFYDEGSAGRMFAASDLPELPDTVEALFIGGISLVPDPCGATVLALAEQAAGRIPVMLDPNIRPFFIADPDAFRARLDRLLALADIVKLSADDLDWLFPGQQAALAAEEILARGPKIVLRTGGAAGAVAHWNAEPVSVPAIRVAVADTIGAGDTFNAGFLAALSRAGLLTRDAIAGITADALAQALSTAARAASVTVSRRGANPPWAHEMI